MPRPLTNPVREAGEPREIVVRDEWGVCPAPGCDERFRPTRADQVYCSAACRKAASRERVAERSMGNGHTFQD